MNLLYIGAGCVPMPTPVKCLCCQEIEAIVSKIAGSETTNLQSITEHEGFEPVCLNVWVFQVSFYTYRHHYGIGDIRLTPQHE